MADIVLGKFSPWVCIELEILGRCYLYLMGLYNA